MEKLRVGIFGLSRGKEYGEALKTFEGVEIAALYDRDTARAERVRRRDFSADTRICKNYDELLSSDIDCVVIANYFHEHAPYAIRAFEHGIAVLSECTAAATLKECAELCDAYEKYNGRYMLAENYPYTAPMLAIEKKCREGKFGRILYAEGEYNHTGTAEMLAGLSPTPYHWRKYLPRTYYCTHSLGPLMYCTKQDPVSVSAFAVQSEVLKARNDGRQSYDAFAMMTCRTEDGALFRFDGCGHMGSKSGYRIAGEYGSGETGRTLGGQVNIHYHDWCKPADEEIDSTFQPSFPEKYAKAVGHGHDGGDYCVAKNFVDYIRNGETPFFDVYRACTMSAVGILGWRSCLENGKVYDIPDFHDKAQREAVRNDDLTPFPDENGNGATLPCHI